MSHTSIFIAVDKDETKFGAREAGNAYSEDRPITDDTHIYVVIGGIDIEMTVAQARTLAADVVLDIGAIPETRQRNRELRAAWADRRKAS